MKRNSIKRSIRQILAITEKEISLQLRVKANFFSRIFEPVLQLVIFFFLFGFIFTVGSSGSTIGYWNRNNFVLFLILAFCIQFSKSIISKYRITLMVEKYWKTLSAIMIAPVNRFTLLVGTLISELAVISIPLCVLLIIAWIFYPISFFYIFLSLIILFSIFITFSSIGLIIGVLGMSHEEYIPYLQIILRFAFLLSCTNYPKEIFPGIIQDIVLLNPFYYMFDLLRLTWYLGINYEVAISHITPLHIIITMSVSIISPIISLYLFDKIYKKYGITGY